MSTPDFPRPITFRLYPEPKSSLFCRVNVWRDKAEMLAYLSASRCEEFAEHHARARAIASGRECLRVHRDGRTRKSGEFCEINCYRRGLDIELVCHEATHATFRWAARVGLDVGRRQLAGHHPDCSEEEERFCYALGRMTNDFAWQLQRRKVWRRPMASAEVFDPDADD